MLAAVSASAAAVVDDVEITASGTDINVTYSLSEDAMVTVEFFTNSVPVASPRVWGDVNKAVAAGEQKSMNWRREGSAAAGEDVAVTAKVRAWSSLNPPPVMVHDLYCPDVVSYYQSLEQLPDGAGARAYKVSKVVYVRIPAKGVTFKMGSPAGEVGRTTGEYEHFVTLTNDFYLGIYPLTQGQSQSIIENTDYMEKGYGMTAYDTCSSYGSEDGDDWLLTPIDYMSSFKLINVYSKNADNVYFLEQGLLWNYHRVTGVHAYLPTEAEWEYACRAGRSGPLNADGDVDDIAWHSGNSGGRLRPVGLKKPNDWGLYDMLGNVWECCRDSWRSGLDSTAVTAPLYWVSGRSIVSRGGAFNVDASHARSAARHSGGGKDNDQGASGCEGEGFRLMIPIFN